MKRFFKIISIIVLIPVSIILLVSILLYIPSFQNFAVDKGAAYASKATGYNIEVGRIDLRFPLNLTVKDIEVKTQNNDTMLLARRVSVDIKMLPLLKKEIKLSSINLEYASFNSDTLVDGMLIEGYVKDFSVEIDKVNLKNEEVILSYLKLYNSNIDVDIQKLPESDTTDSITPFNWKFKVDKTLLSQIDLKCRMDTLSLGGKINYINIADVQFMAEKMDIAVNNIDINMQNAYYLNGKATTYDGKFNPDNINIEDLSFVADSIDSHNLSTIRAKISKSSFSESISGLDIKSFTADLNIDSIKVAVPELNVITSNKSEISININGATDAFTPKGIGDLTLNLDALISKNDIFIFVDSLPGRFEREFPSERVSINTSIKGNVSDLVLRSFNVEIPKTLKADIKGEAGNILNPKRRYGDMKMRLEGTGVSLFLGLIDSDSVGFMTLPDTINLSGDFKLENNIYKGLLSGMFSNTVLDVSGMLNYDNMSYSGSVKIDSLNIKEFVPKSNVSYTSFNIKGEGVNFDPLSSKFKSDFVLKISQLEVDTFKTDSFLVKLSAIDNKYNVFANSSWELIPVQLNAEGDISPEKISLDLKAAFENVDLYKLGIVKKPFQCGTTLSVNAQANIKDSISISSSLTNSYVMNNDIGYRIRDLFLNTHASRDTTSLYLTTGDLYLKANSNTGLKEILTDINSSIKSVKSQIEHQNINLTRIRRDLPDVSVEFDAGKDNAVYGFVKLTGTTFKAISFDIKTSIEDGLFSNIYIDSLMKNNIALDTIRLSAYQQDTALLSDFDIISKDTALNGNYRFSINSSLYSNKLKTVFKFIDAKNRKGLDMGLNTIFKGDSVIVSVSPLNPIIAFEEFNVGGENYISYSKGNYINADIWLKDKKGAYFSMMGSSKAEESNLVVDLLNIRLDPISDLLPFIPSFGGNFSSQAKYNSIDSRLNMSGGIQVESLVFDKNPLGDIALTLDYTPSGDSLYNVGSKLYHNKKKIVDVSGRYIVNHSRDDRKYINGEVKLSSIPLALVNGFIPDNMMRVSGALSGDIKARGKLELPSVSGFIKFDTTKIYYKDVATTFSIDSKDITINRNLLTMDNFQIFAAGKNPFVIDGSIQLKSLNSILTNLRLTANNMEIINAPYNKESLVYGKLFMNIDASIKGDVMNDIEMDGRAKLLGNSNITYVLKDSPLSVQDRLSGLVTFVNLADTSYVPPETIPLFDGLTVLMNIDIDQAAKIGIDLSDDRSSRVELAGGGNLTFQYTAFGDMYLTGRYTLTGGTIKYALPVIPSKNFSIVNGSYVEWIGSPMDPILNITATENVRTSVTLPDQPQQMVNFVVSIGVKNSIDNLDLSFNLSAPENGAIQNQLASMSPQERSKQAVALLISNIYLGDGGGGGKPGIDMSSALNSLLSSQINNLTGGIKGVDLNFGVENKEYGTSGSYQTGTDYSFSFSKRFYNDRIKIIIGGRVATGAPQDYKQTFIDNVALEYKLDLSGTRYIELFYDKNYESILEGEITEAGTGIVLRRNVSKLHQLFKFTRSREEKDKEKEKGKKKNDKKD